MLSPAKSTTLEPKKKPRFLDSWEALAILVGAILVVRFFIFEPFKIPSGSMEPTLIGHESYGDRIVTNKLAYKKSFGGEDPKRFDVVVFLHESKWQNPAAKNVKKNYIKRLVGLPGETILISGGDLFVKDKTSDKFNIIRKWEYGEEMQAILWQPVSVATFKELPIPEVPEHPSFEERMAPLVATDRNRLAFPWNVELETSDASTGSVQRAERHLDAKGPVTLTYMHQVDNTYVKMGRWLFKHEGCPASQQSVTDSETGLVFTQKDAPEEVIAPYIPNSWSGVGCPNCGRIRFPIGRDRGVTLENPNIKADPSIYPKPDAKPPIGFASPELAGDFKTPYFYGGFDLVGDLKLELDFKVLTEGGALEIEVGSNLNRAIWRVSLGSPLEPIVPKAGQHPVKSSPNISSDSKLSMALTYVDATVIASLNGTEVERQLIDAEPIGRKAIQTVARVRLIGNANVSISRLNVYRDLYYTYFLDGNSPVSEINAQHHSRRIFIEAEKTCIFHIEEGHYMVLGDNSPSSSDSRAWGFVPAENMLGKASLVWWPPSRWRSIK